MSGSSSDGGTGSVEHDWYCEADGDAGLGQGDVLLNFPAASIAWDRESEEFAIATSSMPVIVVTQTCDIPKNEQSEVMLATIRPFSDYVARGGNYSSSNFRKALGQGTAIAEFALPPIPDHTSDYLVVNFRKLLVLPKEYVQAKSERLDRYVLRSPYREYFAQAYARFVMRVGLPLPLGEIPKPV